MKKYSSYKDSGVEWLGEIPSNWSRTKLSYYISVKDGTHNTPKYVDEGGYPLVTQKDITSGVLDFSKTKNISEQDYIEINKRSDVEYGDIIMSMIGSIGNPTMINTKEPFSIKNVCLFKTSTSDENSKFLLYLLSSKLLDTVLEYNSRGGVQGFVSLDVLRNLIYIKPPLNEQQQIVSFLDEKTDKIDSLIQHKEKKIELLKEKRTSLINQVVTKGLDPNVEFKDSGVEWIGEIPNHWIINKVGNNTYVKGRIGWKGLRSEDFIDEGPYLITGTDFNKDGTINWDNMYHVDQERYDEDPFIQLQDNDVLITKDGTIGKVVHVGNLKGQTCLNSGVFLTRCTNKQYISRFFFWMLNSQVFKVFVDYNSGGSTIQHLYQNVFVNFKFPIPPLNEQQRIVEYLDEQTQEIDTLIQLEQNKIELLKEYRQSLISEVVTGKVRVCEEDHSLNLESQKV
jgi:type I restriction enzyme S subunit